MPNRHRPDDLAWIETKARSMARSGKYRSHVEIRNLLEAHGFELTARVFDNLWSQTEIDRLCRKARAIAAAA
jgi:hypothetical protein